jgi:hypothetical protein
MSTHEDDQGSGASAYGRPRPDAGQPEQWRQEPAQSYGQQYPQPEYGGQPYGRPEYGQPQYGRPEYGQPEYGQPEYGQAAHGQYPAPYVPPGPAAYGQPGAVGHGEAATAPRPGGVVTAAVLGFLFGALGVVISLVAIFLGAVATGASGSADNSVPGLGSVFGAVGGAIIVAGILALVWTVVMIWGSVWALTGRSRVLLLVGGSIALALSVLQLLGALAHSGGSSIVSSVVFTAAALLIVVLLSAKDAAAFYASHRSLRARS